MANIEVKLRRGTTSQHAGFQGADGEVTVDTDKKTLIVHTVPDVGTPDSTELRRKDDTIAGSEIDAGTVDTTQLATGAVTHDRISSTDAVFKINSSDQVRIGGDLSSSGLEATSQFGITSSTAGSILSLESTATSQSATAVITAPGNATLQLNDTSESGNDKGVYNIESTAGTFNIGSLEIGGGGGNLDCITFERKTLSAVDYILPHLENLPTFADNSAAVTGGLATNDVYKTATGELRIVV
jgi:hypothetical protein